MSQERESIEIEEGLFYYPNETRWYRQDPELIALAISVMQGTPSDSLYEESGEDIRMSWGEWVHTTDLGQFLMRVDFTYEYPIEDKAFKTKYVHDTVVITQIV